MAVEIKLPVDTWYDIISILHNQAASEDDEQLDEYADAIHEQLEKWESARAAHRTKWRNH